jgi:hypothetical protein
MKTTEILNRIDFLNSCLFSQTNFDSHRTWIGKGNMYFVKEDFKKTTSNEEWNLHIDTRHFECSDLISEFMGTLNILNSKSNIEFKIESINSFIFWRKKTIIDRYLIEGSKTKTILESKEYLNLLISLQNEGLSISRKGPELSFKLYLNSNYNNTFLVNLLELIQQLSKL